MSQLFPQKISKLFLSSLIHHYYTNKKPLTEGMSRQQHQQMNLTNDNKNLHFIENQSTEDVARELPFILWTICAVLSDLTLIVRSGSTSERAASTALSN